MSHSHYSDGLLCVIALTISVAWPDPVWIPRASDTSSDDTRPLSTRLPERVAVVPVFLVPVDAQLPSDDYKQLFLRHIKWTQTRYRELLFGRDTFTLADRDLPLVLHGKHSIDYYKKSPAQGAEAAVLELFEHDKVNRFSCPFIYVVLFVGTGEWPKGGGTPFNGHVNTGGGVVVLAADNLVKDVGFNRAFNMRSDTPSGWFTATPTD